MFNTYELQDLRWAVITSIGRLEKTLAEEELGRSDDIRRTRVEQKLKAQYSMLAKIDKLYIDLTIANVTVKRPG